MAGNIRAADSAIPESMPQPAHSEPYMHFSIYRAIGSKPFVKKSLSVNIHSYYLAGSVEFSSIVQKELVGIDEVKAFRPIQPIGMIVPSINSEI